MIEIAVGKPFPGRIPQNEGAYLELTGNSLSIIIQYPGLNNQEKKAFKKSFKKYAFLEPDLPIPIPFFIFLFPEPFNEIDVNFNSKIVDRKLLDEFLEMDINLITFYLLDRNILKAMKAVGMHHESILQLKDTIKKQLEMDYNKNEFYHYLNAMYQYSTLEMFNMGTQYIHKQKKI